MTRIFMAGLRGGAVEGIWARVPLRSLLASRGGALCRNQRVSTMADKDRSATVLRCRSGLWVFRYFFDLDRVADMARKTASVTSAHNRSPKSG